jgi:REP element-mobilizing transposase RayT
MAFNKDIHHRKSIRLRGYDYSQPGAYFITICTHQRQSLFGDIVDGVMMLNTAGNIAHDEWKNISDIRHDVSLCEFVIMPNHMHGIINVGAHCMRPMNNDMNSMNNMHSVSGNQQSGRVQRAPTVGDIVRGYKSAVTKRLWESCGNQGHPVWQRNYHEHIIRNEQAYQNIAEYIRANPQKWQDDVYCTASVQGGTKP